MPHTSKTFIPQKRDNLSVHFTGSLLSSRVVLATTAASRQAGKPRKQSGEWSRACCFQLAEFPWGVSGTGHSVCQTESHPAGSPCSTFHPERNCVPPHFRRKTAVWCSILETCERSVIERVASHGSWGPLKVSTGYSHWTVLCEPKTLVLTVLIILISTCLLCAQ